MGKYTQLKNKLPKGQRREDVGDFVQRVNEVKRRFLSGRNLKDVMAYYRHARDQKEGIEDQLTEVNAKVRAAEDLIIEAQDSQGLSSFKDDDGNVYYQEVVPQVKVKDEEAAKKWVSEEGLDFLWSIQPMRLASTIKEMVLEGKEVPDFIEMSSFTKLKLKKGASSGKERDTEEEPF